MNRYAFTFTIKPEMAGAVAGILAYYLPGVTLVRNDRVVHVIDTRDAAGTLAARLRGTSRPAPVIRALTGCWRAPDGLAGQADGEAFLAATLMETATHYERPDRASLASSGLVERSALLPPAHAGPAWPPAALFDSQGSPERVLLTSSVFRNSSVVVWFREARAETAEGPPPLPAGRAMLLLSATDSWSSGGGDEPNPARHPGPFGGLAHARTHR